MDKNQELERGIIPAGTRIKLYEGRVTLLEEVVVDANQGWIDKAIQDQEDYFNGIGITCEPKLAAGAVCTPKKSIQYETNTLNIPDSARFINIIEWRTNMIDRLLSYIHIKTIDEAVAECQKIEEHVFARKELNASTDWRLL